MLRTVQQFRCPIHSDESLSADGAAVHGEVGEGFVYGGIRTAFGKAHKRKAYPNPAARCRPYRLTVTCMPAGKQLVESAFRAMRNSDTHVEKTKDHKRVALWSDFDQWLSLALPRALLRAKTFLPFAVAILLRKPCTFFR